MNKVIFSFPIYEKCFDIEEIVVRFLEYDSLYEELLLTRPRYGNDERVYDTKELDRIETSEQEYMDEMFRDSPDNYLHVLCECGDILDERKQDFLEKYFDERFLNEGYRKQYAIDSTNERIKRLHEKKKELDELIQEEISLIEKITGE